MFKVTQKFYAPDDAGSGAPPAENAPETRTETPAFDPSTVDVSNPDALAVLNEEQMAAVEKYNKEHETEAAPKPEGEETAEESTEASAGNSDAAPVKYADKYDTVDDLVKGVTEIAKKLNVPEWSVQAALDTAKELGKYGAVEALYKRMEQELGAKSAQPAPTPAPAPVADTASTDTPDPKLLEAVNQLTLSELARSPLAQQMAARGLSIPRNVKEFEELVDAQPFFAAEFRRLYEDGFARNIEEAQNVAKAAKEVEGANKQAVDSDTAEVRATAEKFGIKLTDAEIEAVRSEALQKPWNYETRYGQKFLRPGAIKDTFMATRLVEKIAEIRAAAEAAGRTQAVEDLKRVEKKGVSTISTSRLSTKTREAAKMPDLTDPEVLANLPDEALADPEKYFKQFKK